MCVCVCGVCVCMCGVCGACGVCVCVCVVWYVCASVVCVVHVHMYQSCSPYYYFLSLVDLRLKCVGRFLAILVLM